jgi:Icc-related predicted phosphoesterase
MRCLLAADLHYSLQQFDWVKEVAEYFDIVVLAGDHLDVASMPGRSRLTHSNKIGALLSPPAIPTDATRRGLAEHARHK